VADVLMNHNHCDQVKKTPTNCLVMGRKSMETFLGPSMWPWYRSLSHFMLVELIILNN
jgi:hypothetical protein